MISGAGDIPMAVEAIKSGAFDFIEKPFDLDAVVARVRRAIDAWARRGSAGFQRREFPGHHLLTPREREVLAEIAAGASNKEAGRRLGISPRTIEVHRARIMDKLRAKNAADLVRIVLTEGADH
jgi:FixJ family two-component response regulator